MNPVPGLAVSPDATTEPLEHFSAVRLFLARVRRVRLDFSLSDDRAGVVRIRQLVEGMPLAIELAASWLKSLGCLPTPPTKARIASSSP